ncbi:guanine-N(7)-methyltransferase [Tothia fuscella]|uniref:mRNA cap guanine-N(7) methyltransferase n=1 Tax=Tothia fuscella TaxID=1048955 RepID=A0A9P4U2T0_9PEZI|nr:guanine-N(7)-methyltransferase [Tothia fuscella]
MTSSSANNLKRPREPSPPPPSPPRKAKRPAGRARIPQAQVDQARRREQERENAHQQEHAPDASVASFVTQHYNAVPERGRDWRNTDSQIKGLRSYNNWVKSVLIKKFSPPSGRSKVLDMGCGKGGDLAKWQHQNLDLYVGLDPADVSIEQAKGRHRDMTKKARGRIFHAEFGVKDCFGESLDTVPVVRQVGFDKEMDVRWGGGGFDTVSMMFCMHYAFQNEDMARQMLKNVAGALKKGGKLIGVIPNSDVLSAKVEEYHKKHNPQPEEPANEAPKKTEAVAPKSDADPSPSKEEPKKAEESPPLEFGNTIYRVKFPNASILPADGTFRPPFGWKYFYFLEEAVDVVPEYVVPWEAFRALAEDFNLELEYRKSFMEVWDEEGRNREFGQLAERMKVKDRNGNLQVSDEERDAASLYHAFAFYKV